MPVTTTHKVTVEHNIPAAMRDGTILRADVYRPETPGEYPVLLCRTPYGKTRRPMHKEIGHGMGERGYIVVYQDIRGRYASEGIYNLRQGGTGVNHCINDGHDTVEWCAELPGSTGKVGTFGNSYCGLTQWDLAPTRPKHLVCMFAQGLGPNHLDRHMYGVFRTGRRMTWVVNNISVDTARRHEIPWGPQSPEEADELWTARDRSKWLWFLPLAELPEHAMPGMKEHWQRVLRDTTRDYIGHEKVHKDINVPVLSGTGWYDQQIGTINQFTGMVQNGMTENARASQRLIVGPWGHTTLDLKRKLGEMDFGPEAEWDYYEVADAWFSKWLKGEKTAADEWPPVQVFVMGANTWRHEDAWPPKGMTPTPWYLHSGGKANSHDGDGALSPEPPAGSEPSDEYDYDPRDPLMTLYNLSGQMEPMDYRRLDGRRDMLTFRSAPLEEPVEVVGPVEVTLHAASSAPDTDFIAKLMDVHPDGFVQEIAYGLIRARYRNGTEKEDFIEPGKVYEYTFKLTPTGNRFLKGHRIRLQIQSSDFPNFDRNHNTGGDDYFEATLKTARQTIFHDAERPSRVVLPVVPIT